MHPKKWLLVWINLLGGSAVLGSYLVGFLTQPGAAQTLWGGVPHIIRPIYTFFMFVAAAGFFAFTSYVLFRLNPAETRVFNRFGYGLFNALYAAILIPSALWMPLTFFAVEQSGSVLLWGVRGVLAAAGLASIGLLLALANVEPRQPVWAHRTAMIGIAGFSIQTVLLDAIVWSAFFQI